jgi:hypothetical protein
MKDECQEVANGLIEELEKLFLEHEIMIILGVIYTWYWVTNPKEVEYKFVFFSHGYVEGHLKCPSKGG